MANPRFGSNRGADKGVADLAPETRKRLTDSDRNRQPKPPTERPDHGAKQATEDGPGPCQGQGWLLSMTSARADVGRAMISKQTSPHRATIPQLLDDRSSRVGPGCARKKGDEYYSDSVRGTLRRDRLGGADALTALSREVHEER